ncbi:MAG: hypothetical protein FJ100_07625 [Deltaproteobacteria bacterium]|nr:hypothetical protein [Deltaproteobacteria bacterium]
MRFVLSAFAVLACGLLPTSPRAGELHGSVRSLTWGTRDLKPGAWDQTQPALPTLQHLTLRGDALGGTGLYFDGSAFAMQQLAGSGSAPTRRGDLVYGYLGWQNAGRSARVQLGRQLVLSGAPRYTTLDGVFVDLLGPADLRVQVHGGTAVFAGFDHALKAPAVGARVQWQPALRGHVAVAIQDVSGLAAATRRTVGADFSARLPGETALAGSAAYDLLGRGLQDARVDLSNRPRPWLGLHLRGELRDPIAYLSADSIFQAFVQRTDGVVGAGFDVQTPGALHGSGSYERFVAGDGHLDGYRGQVDVGLRLDDRGEDRIGATLARVGNGDNGYSQARLWWRGRLRDALRPALDLDALWYFRPIRGHDQSLVATASVRWTGKAGLSAGVDAQWWSNPAFTAQALVLATVSATDDLFRPTAPPPPPLTPPKAETEDDEEDEGEGEKPAPKPDGAPSSDKPAEQPKADDEDDDGAAADGKADAVARAGGDR